MNERRSDWGVPITLAVIVHLTIAGLFALGFWQYKHPKPQPQQLAIEATVVDMKSLPAGTLPSQTTPVPPVQPPPEPAPVVVPPPEPKPEPQPEPSPPKPLPPKPPDVRQEQERERAEARRLEQERAASAKQQQEKTERDRAAREKVAADKVAAEKLARESADRKAKEEAERKVREKAEQLASQKAADAKLRSQREAELRAQVAAEERLVAAQSSGAMAQYLAQIRGRIERAWIRPASAKPGLSCDVRVTQVPGGEVVSVQVMSCNGDEAVRQSIEAAAYRASPLPQPSDAALFDRNLVVTFKPEE